VKKETQEYILGIRNATRDEFILSRESAGNAEYVVLCLPDMEEPIYALWTKKPKKRKGSARTGEIVNKPKHTGGKRPYIMLMQDNKDIVDKIPLEAAGMLLKLLAGGFIEWDTGRIIDRRTKKPMTRENIKNRYRLSPKDTKTIFKALTDSNIIKHDQKERAYFFNAQFAKKGAGGHEN